MFANSRPALRCSSSMPTESQVIEKELLSLEVLFSLDVVLFSLAVFSTFVVFARSDILFSLDVFSTFLGTSATEC